jgi:hypothetical protein
MIVTKQTTMEDLDERARNRSTGTLSRVILRVSHLFHFEVKQPLKYEYVENDQENWSGIIVELLVPGTCERRKIDI